jgi:uncharacterized membrane protein YqaE (UPF0057 family)
MGGRSRKAAIVGGEAARVERSRAAWRGRVGRMPAAIERQPQGCRRSPLRDGAQAASFAAPRPDHPRVPETPMRLLLAIFLPFLVFFTIGRPIAGIVCLILQITLIGWIPAALWAVYALGQWKTDKRIEEAIGRKAS